MYIYWKENKFKEFLRIEMHSARISVCSCAHHYVSMKVNEWGGEQKVLREYTRAWDGLRFTW